MVNVDVLFHRSANAMRLAGRQLLLKADDIGLDSMQWMWR